MFNKDDLDYRPLTVAEREMLRAIFAGLDDPHRQQFLPQLDDLTVKVASDQDYLIFANVARDTFGSTQGDRLDYAIDVLDSQGLVIGGIRIDTENDELSALNTFLLRNEPWFPPAPEHIRVNSWKTRPLSENEAGVLRKLLSAMAHPSRDALLRQIDTLSVEASSIATWTDLVHSDDAAPVFNVPSPLPINAEVFDDAGQSIGGIELFMGDGYLASIDFHWWHDYRPEIFPHPDHVVSRPYREPIWLDD